MPTTQRCMTLATVSKIRGTDHLDKVTFLSEGEWEAVHVIDRTKPYVFRARRLLAPAPCLLVWGRAAQLPSGSVSAVDKEAAGAAIKERVR